MSIEYLDNLEQTEYYEGIIIRIHYLIQLKMGT